MSVAAVLADAFIGSAGSRILIAALTAVAMAGFVASLSVVFGKRQARVERRLAGYEAIDVVNRPLPPSAAFAPESGVVQQAVEFTSRLAERTGLLSRVDFLLEQADLPVRSGELLFYAPTFALLAFLIGALLAGPLVGLALGIGVAAVPLAYVFQRRDARVRHFERQLPDTLTLLAGAMRAGFSFLQGLETVSEESHGPMRRELQRVFTEVRLGRAIEEALGDTAERMGSRDLAWTVMAIRIQREVGGNLAQLLDTVADTMTKRERLRREIRSLTAEGRLSAVVVSLFPPIFAVILLVIQKDYLERLFDETMGVVAVIGAAILSVAGWFWLRKIVDIEV